MVKTIYTYLAFIAVATSLMLTACSDRPQEKSEASEGDTGAEVLDHENPSIEGVYATLRNHSIAANKEPPRMMPVQNEDLRKVRNYPEQPPLIPHKIDGYQVDSRHNTCLTCHSRVAVGVSQAPMVSISHFMDRDGQFLASVSPRRYFCNQCHVPQHNVTELIENTFVDVDSVLAEEVPAGLKEE